MATANKNFKVKNGLDVNGAIAATSTISASGLAGSLLTSTSPSMDGSVSAGTSTIPARADHVHPTDTSRAPLSSPTFTGTVSLPTTNISGVTTVANYINRTSANGNSSWMQQDGTGRVHWYWNTLGGTSPTFTNAGEDASALSLHITGSGAGGTLFHRSASGLGKNAGDAISWTTTLYVDLNSITYKGSTIWHSGNDGASSGLDADLLDGQQGSFYAPLASPAFTGTPSAPTAATGTNTTQIATTAYVRSEINNTPSAALHPFMVVL